MITKMRAIAAVCCLIITASAPAASIDVFQGAFPDSSTFLGRIEAYAGTDPAAVNYDYFSRSAHPDEGPNTRFNRGEIFFYDGPEGTSFNVIFNKDRRNQNDPITSGLVSWNIFAASAGGDPSVLLSDDGRELREADEDFFRGRWEWRNNTDGGIIGGLGSPIWAMIIDPREYDGLDSLKVFGATGERIDLNLRTGERGTMFFVMHVPEAGSTMLLLSMGVVGIGLLSRRLNRP